MENNEDLLKHDNLCQFDNNTKQVWVKGQLSKHSWPDAKLEDLKTMYGISIEAEIRCNLRDALVKEFNLNERENRSVLVEESMKLKINWI